ncbi:hypothetical protein ACFX2H_009165 [Malus domestica]
MVLEIETAYESNIGVESQSEMLREPLRVENWDNLVKMENNHVVDEMEQEKNHFYQNRWQQCDQPYGISDIHSENK